jgi:hypothetical protein
MNLKNIEFVLENCECISINKENIYQLYIGKITSSYHWQNHLDSISPNYHTDYCKIDFVKLKPECVTFINEAVKDEQEAFNRLFKHRDVTSIVLHFDDGTEQQIYLPWKGWEFINKSQRAKKDFIEWENKNYFLEAIRFINTFYYMHIYLPITRFQQKIYDKKVMKRYDC